MWNEEFKAALAAFFLSGGARAWAFLGLLIVLGGALPMAGFACEALAGDGEKRAWMLRVSDETWTLPESCSEALAQVVARLAASARAKVSIESILDAPDVSSLNIARVAGLTSRLERALGERGIGKRRIRLSDYRLPRRDRTFENEVGRVIIRVSDEPARTGAMKR